MPAYNEEKTLAKVVHAVLARPLAAELIVVDDASRDGTWQVMQTSAANEPRLQIFQHPINQGKGAALRTGFSKATQPYVIIQDADLEYDPGEYAKLLGPIRCNRADVVFGSRFLGSKGTPASLLLAFGRKHFPDHAQQHVHQPQSHRHGNLLQSFPT